MKVSKNIKKYSSGFTLIEVLVVLGIITVLIAIVSASFTDARISARDKSLITEMKETKLAIELYKAQNGKYPDRLDINSCRKSDSNGNPYIAFPCGTWTSIIKDLVPDYADKMPMPQDSANSACEIVYTIDPDRSFYKLSADNCIAGEAIQPTDEMAVCPVGCSDCRGSTYNASDPDFYQSVAVYSFGGECL